MGWSIMKVYRDEGVSGAKSRAERPAFNALWKDATCRRFDMVMAWSVDRLGRSLQDLVPFLSELHALRIDLYLHQQGVDTSTPAGKALFQMTGVFAEFERAMIRERVKSGVLFHGIGTPLRGDFHPIGTPSHRVHTAERSRKSTFSMRCSE
jgi:DNA invertase Pin-like site-specific DNA recombinase